MGVLGKKYNFPIHDNCTHNFLLSSCAFHSMLISYQSFILRHVAALVQGGGGGYCHIWAR